MSIATRYTAEDITYETLEAHPELGPLVDAWEHHRAEPSATEALLINVIVRQANAMQALANVAVAYRLKYGWLQHETVA
jgi:hypothetical protein